MFRFRAKTTQRGKWTDEILLKEWEINPEVLSLFDNPRSGALKVRIQQSDGRIKEWTRVL